MFVRSAVGVLPGGTVVIRVGTVLHQGRPSVAIFNEIWPTDHGSPRFMAGVIQLGPWWNVVLPYYVGLRLYNTINGNCILSLISLRPNKNMCVSDFPTDSPFSRRPTHVFLLCDSKFFYWGSYRKNNEVNRTTLWEVMRVWRQNFLKWVQILNIWREISLQDNNKIFHSFFEYRLSFFIVRLKVFFIEDHI